MVRHATNIQYPVGQGGLHLGIVNQFAYIYDCGGYGDPLLVNWTHILTEVVSNISNCERLYIYISHFHEDHCNKLGELLKRLPDHLAVKLYYPGITDIQKIMLLAEYGADDEDVSYMHNDKFSEYYELISDTDQYVKKQKLEIETASLHPFHVNAQMKYKKMYKTVEFISQGDVSTKQFILDAFATLHDQNKIGQFKKLLRVEGFNNERRLLEAIKSDPLLLGRLRRIYRTSVGLSHGTMLCLYAGFDKCSEQYNWLYTGDMKLLNITQKKFYTYYQAYFDYLSYVQIPHHGSRYNHDNSFKVLNRNHHTKFFLTKQNSPSSRSRKHITPSIQITSALRIIEVDETSEIRV